jgi:xanthine dehydrogenase YagR molybdenum-binding subunit
MSELNASGAQRPETVPVEIGMPLSRVDGPAKVTGAARYAAEYPVAGLAHGVVVSGRVAHGSIRAIDSAAALAVPGVLAVLTHENRPRIRTVGMFYKDMDAPHGTPFRPLLDATIHYAGQPVALVVADTYEAARHAASLVEVTYDGQAHQTSLAAGMLDLRGPEGQEANSEGPDARGNADEAFNAAQVALDAEYHVATEHHNPIEMHASTVILEANGHLTIYDKSQGALNSRLVVSHVFGIPKENITVRNPYVGGAFGSGLRPQYQLILAVLAVKALARSVRVVLTRQQMFSFGYRPETWQRVRLGAMNDGTLTALIHEAVAATSRFEQYKETVVDWSGQMYKCDNVRFNHRLVELDLYTPLDMRAPGATLGMHAIEVAMDELSYKLGMDPLALRLANYAERDANQDRPFSSKELRACFSQGAQRFGWERRPAATRAMRDGRELIGWGMASATWDASQQYGNARAVFRDDGSLTVWSATSDIGTGTYTAMTLIAAAAMGLPVDSVTFLLGDSDFPSAPLEGGSQTVASVGPAVQAVCGKLRKILFDMTRKLPDSPFSSAVQDDVEFSDGAMRLRDNPAVALPLTDILHLAGATEISESNVSLPNLLEQREYTRASHSAVFAEVRVDEEFGTVRVTRVVSAIAAGRIVSLKTARSQIIGGVVWGISHALHEETMCDHKLGRFVNRNLGDYHMAANADVQDIEVIFVHEDDTVVNPLGAKGVGEIGLIGVSAAICNALYHATGRRIRSLPMTLDKVMAV